MSAELQSNRMPGATITAEEDASRLGRGEQAIGFNPRTPRPLDDPFFIDPTANFENPAPLLDLERPNIFNNLSYPIDLGSSIYKHAMRISIFKQKASKRDIGIADNTTPDDFNYRAGQNAGGDLITKETVAIAGGVALTRRAAQNIVGGGNFAERAAVGVGTTVIALGGVALTNVQSQTRKTEKRPLAYINLYIPETLNFVDKHDYDSVSITDTLGVAGALQNPINNATELLARATQLSGTGIGDNIVRLGLFASGYALNPMLEVLYKGPKNREYIFSFKFIPRNSDEADEIQKIIKTLRFHSAPEYEQATGASRYLIPPSEFEIEFLDLDGTEANRNTKLPRLTSSFLTNVDVNYASSGQYSTFTDGNPIEIMVQLSFTENLLLTKADIERGY